MIKKLTLIFLILGVFIISGCTSKRVYTSNMMKFDGNSVDYSKLNTLKKGEACKNSYKFEGDTTIQTAAKNGGISKVVYVEDSIDDNTFLWFFWGKTCVTVYGE